MNTTESNPSNPLDLYYEAQRLRNEGDPDSALQCYSECLELLDRNKDVLEQMRILMEMEEVFGARGAHSKAMACLRTCLNYVQELGQEYEKSVVLHRMGHLLYRTEESETATQRVEDSFSISRSLGDQRGYALSRAMLGKIQFSRGEVNEGLGLMVESMSILHAINASEWEPLNEQIRKYRKQIPSSIYELSVRTKTDDPEVVSLLLS